MANWAQRLIEESGWEYILFELADFNPMRAKELEECKLSDLAKAFALKMASKAFEID